MDDFSAKLAAIEAMRPVIGDTAADAAIAALHGPQTTAPSQCQEAQTIANSPQSSLGGDATDSAIGSGNAVLHHITIAEGGTLIVGAAPTDLPPQPAAVADALRAYLRTLLQLYQLINLRGLGAGNTQQARIALRAVFINLRTTTVVAELAVLVGARVEPPRPARRLPATSKGREELSADTRQWLDELLSAEQRAYLQRYLVSSKQSEAATDSVQLQAIQQIFAAPRTALELIRHHPALVLLGDPGSGKTTVLRHLMLAFVQARLEADEQRGVAVEPEVAWAGPLPLPILVQLRRFADNHLHAPPDSAGPLLDHLEGVLSRNRVQILAQHLVARLEAGEVLLLLDGLDEIADDTSRAWAAQAIGQMHSRFPNSRIVVTCRVYAYRDAALLPPPFQAATLQPLDGATRDDFIRRWYQAVLLHSTEVSDDQREQVADERARALIDGLERRPRLREIAGNPLLLTLIALLHQQRLRLPQQRAELYRECLLLLLEQWEQRRLEGGLGGLVATLGIPEQTNRLALIQPIAYELQVLGREEATHVEARRWLLERFLDICGGDGSRAKELIRRFLEFLEGRSGLLIARDIGDRYAFPHKTFQEYLVACELILQGDKETEQAVVEHRHAPTWREVILLVAGQLVANGQPRSAKALAWKLLDNLDAPGTPEAYRNAVLAGEIVEELAGNLGREGQSLRAEVVQALVSLVEGGHLSATERVEAALLLGRLGDVRLPTPDQSAYWCHVDAGPFWFREERRNQKLRQVDLPYSFQIARFLVTNAEFQCFIEDDGYNPDKPWWTERGRTFLLPGGHRYDDQERPITLPRLWHDARFNNPSQPVVGVSRYEATAFCNWLTAKCHAAGWLLSDAVLRLPTALEWERAARHTDKRRYPWGNTTPDAEPNLANYNETGIGQPSPVGCFPEGAAMCGALDMSGNVFEWIGTAHGTADTSKSRKDSTVTKRLDIPGGAYAAPVEFLRCGSRVRGLPGGWNSYQGFRLVRSLMRSL